MSIQSGIGKPGQKPIQNITYKCQIYQRDKVSDFNPPVKAPLHLLFISCSNKAPFIVTASQHIFQFPGVFNKIAFIKGEKTQTLSLTFDFGLIHSHGSLTKLLVTFVICLMWTIYSASCPEALGCPRSKWRLFPVRFVTNLI